MNIADEVLADLTQLCAEVIRKRRPRRDVLIETCARLAAENALMKKQLEGLDGIDLVGTESVAEVGEIMARFKELFPAHVHAAVLAGAHHARKDQARSGAQAKLANDPKQEAKAFVKNCWRDWRAGRSTYRTKAEFARDMLDKFPGVLVSTPVIEGWVRRWDDGKD